MREARLNLLLANPPGKRVGGMGQLWQQTVSQLLTPLGVRTFEANSGPAAVELMERHPIHLAVVDTQLPAIGGLNVLQLIQRLKEHGQKTVTNDARLSSNAACLSSNEARLSANAPHFSAGGGGTMQFQVRVEHRSQAGNTQQRFEVRIETRGTVTGAAPPYAPMAPPSQPPGPVVILIAPPPAQQDKELLREALKFNAFSVLSEPVEVEVALEVMARAMKRWFLGQWPAQ